MDTSRQPIGTLFSLKIGKEKGEYRFFDVNEVPGSTVGQLGDLWRDSSGTVWFKAGDGWSKGEDQVTKHPNMPFYLVCSSRGNKPKWVVGSTIRGRRFKAKDAGQAEKRVREEDEEDEEEVEEEMFG
jgi:hypothetical protein